MVHWIFLKYMAQRFVRLLFDFYLYFCFYDKCLLWCKFVQTLPMCQRIFLFADRWGTQSHQVDGGGGLQHMGDLEKQFKMKLWSTKTGRKTLSSFRKSQNHLKNLLGLFSRETRNTAGYFTDFFFFFFKGAISWKIKQISLHFTLFGM